MSSSHSIFLSHPDFLSFFLSLFISFVLPRIFSPRPAFKEALISFYIVRIEYCIPVSQIIRTNSPSRSSRAPIARVVYLLLRTGAFASRRNSSSAHLSDLFSGPLLSSPRRASPSGTSYRSLGVTSIEQNSARRPETTGEARRLPSVADIQQSSQKRRARGSSSKSSSPARLSFLPDASRGGAHRIARATRPSKHRSRARGSRLLRYVVL